MAKAPRRKLRKETGPGPGYRVVVPGLGELPMFHPDKYGCDNVIEAAWRYYDELKPQIGRVPEVVDAAIDAVVPPKELEIEFTKRLTGQPWRDPYRWPRDDDDERS